MRPLSQSEFLQATAEVQSQIRASPKDYQNRMSEEIETAKRMIIKASTSDIGKDDAQITDEVLNRFTIHELLALYKQYNAEVDALNPELESMSEEQINELILTLKKNSESVKELSLYQLRQMLNFLVIKEGSLEAK